MKFRHHLVMILATGGYVGRIPIASGTFGSLLGIPICFALSKTSWMAAILIVVAFTLVAMWVADEAERLLGLKDPGAIVIDEIAGYLLTMIMSPVTIPHIVAGFFLFRFFDIVKPPPVRQAERYLRGGLGVMADDLLAGAYAWICLRLLERFLF